MKITFIFRDNSHFPFYTYINICSMYTQHKNPPIRLYTIFRFSFGFSFFNRHFIVLSWRRNYISFFFYCLSSKNTFWGVVGWVGCWIFFLCIFRQWAINPAKRDFSAFPFYFSWNKSNKKYIVWPTRTLRIKWLETCCFEFGIDLIWFFRTPSFLEFSLWKITTH